MADNDGRELARQAGVPYVCLSDTAPTTTALNAVPIGIARRYFALPLAIEDGTLTVAMANPGDATAIAALAAAARMNIFPLLSEAAAIGEALERWGAGLPGAEKRLRRTILPPRRRRRPRRRIG